MLSQKTALSFCVLTLSGRSSVSLGRMEIRSSSEDSQLTMFENRSRLPSWREPVKLLVAQVEEPMTTKRPGVVPEYVPAAASVSGPFLPFLGSTCPPGPISVTAMLSSLVPKSFVAEPLPPRLHDRASARAETPWERA